MDCIDNMDCTDNISAINKAIDKYYPSWLRLANFSEDVVHNAIIIAYNKADTLRDSRKAGMWIYSIVENAYRNWKRREFRQSMIPVTALCIDEDAGEAFLEWVYQERPNDRVEFEDAAKEWSYFIQMLPLAYKKMIISSIQGRTIKQTAETIGISWEAAESRIRRARGMLKGWKNGCKSG